MSSGGDEMDRERGTRRGYGGGRFSESHEMRAPSDRTGQERKEPRIKR